MNRALMVLLIALCAFNAQAGKKIIVPLEVKKISDALERAEAGDTVFVSKGIYKESIVLKDGVALIGESVKETIVQGKKRGAVVTGADNATIRNFTIRNGEKGILCENISMLIQHNYISDNKGSGIHCLVTLPMIRNNVVYRNGWTGIFCETVKSLNTLVEHNVIGDNGYSGLMLAGNSEVIVQNNVFIGNKQFGIWVNEGARRSRIIYNNFYMNRTSHNFYAQVDATNLAIDPGYIVATGPFGAADIFASKANILKGRGKDGKAIGLVSESDMLLMDQDPDKDGVLGEQDQCPSLPEDLDGFQDDDGCPDFDNDGDGIYDSQDKCPDEAEDFDGFQDKDGCPDYDNDGDGIPDSVDVCPNNAETINNFKDEDGCPDEMPAGGVPQTGKAESAPAQDKAITAKPEKPAVPAAGKATSKDAVPGPKDTAKTAPVQVKKAPPKQ
ncbi:MAG: right-handed parallel beta-helix repeat-containing protein [Chitinispirillaceae bacterium]|nr:right-handed parallel beta-helix repeat-containing protein [Chitinispirillaceae bacterium]